MTRLRRGLYPKSVAANFQFLLSEFYLFILIFKFILVSEKQTEIVNNFNNQEQRNSIFPT